jgi:protoporphyrinogen/coproporphyrinogen III oxidase
MQAYDVVVVGGGISGVAFAHRAAAAGRRTLLLERGDRLGGCVHSARRPSGFWHELGAHTCYATYGSVIELALAAGLRETLLARGPARSRFDLLTGDAHRALGQAGIVGMLSWREALGSLARSLGTRPGHEAVAAFFSRRLGSRNYREVLRPFLTAMLSQDPDAFPARGPGSIGFVKRRRRRKGFPRSFTVDGGLQTLCEAAASRAGLDVVTGVEVHAVAPCERGLAVEAAGGGFAAPVVAVAVDAPAAARLLAGAFPAVAAPIARIRTSPVETLGVAVRRERAQVPEAAFLVPRQDAFHSVVTRDAVPDPAWRGFAFHFKPGLSRDEKLRRAAAVLGVAPAELEAPIEVARALPSPALGHGELVRALDGALHGGALAVTGNYLDAMSLEECVARSAREWDRVAPRTA